MTWPMLLGLMVILAYGNSFRGGFVLDDQGGVLENASIRQLWPFSAILSPPATAGVGGRPVANVSLAVNYAISGIHPWSYHLLNVILHVLAASLLYGVVRRTLLLPTQRSRFGDNANWLGFAVAGLWALHPLQSGTVNYVSQRTELLAAGFVLATLYGCLREIETGRQTWRWMSIIACALAMGSKEVAVIAPVFAMAYDASFGAGSLRDAWRARAGLYLGLAATWLVLAGLMLRSDLAARGVGAGEGVPVSTYFLTECVGVLRYLKLAAWPHPLVFDYGWDFVRDAGRAVAAAMAVAALVAAVGWMWRRQKPAAFASGAFFLLLAPTSSLIPIVQQPIAESRMYLPLAALLSLGAVAIFVAVGRRSSAPIILAALAFAIATAARNPIFRTPETLWSDVLAYRPENARAHSNLAGALLRNGDVADALAHAQQALALRPNYADAETNLGAALMAENRPADALPHLQKAAILQPSSAAAPCNLADALFRTHQPEQAIAKYERALRIDPAYAQAHNNLAVVLLETGRIADAIGHAEAAVRLRPDFPEAHYNLANALVRAGRLDDAITEYQTALNFRPDFPSARKNLGIVEALKK